MTENTAAAAAQESLPACYTIEVHKHRFAAWASSRAASVKGCRFSVEQGRAMLESCGLNSGFSTPDLFPDTPEGIDDQHRRWRQQIIEAGKEYRLTVTHGVAAKLINVYLKCRFVCGGQHDRQRISDLHPPIDDVLQRTLADLNFGGEAKVWRRTRSLRWSKLNSEQYEELIQVIRRSLRGNPLWSIEEHWKGNQ